MGHYYWERKVILSQIPNILIPFPKECKYCAEEAKNIKKDNIINSFLDNYNNYRCNREIYLPI